MHDRVALLFVALLLVLGPWLVWRVPAIRRVAPLAVVQIVAGVLLGPSAFGRAAPEWHAALFAPSVMGALGGLSTLGVALYVFCSGMHLEGAALRDGARRLGAPALGSMVLPLLLGLGAGIGIAALWPQAMGPRAELPAFATAIGICVAVTALPVLAAILKDMGLTETRLGQTALALAALNDLALWLAIALLLALTHGSAADTLRVGALSLLWLGAMGWLAQPVLRQWAERPGWQGDAALVPALAVTFAAAATAELVGLGFIIGAFAAGCAIPAGWRGALLARLEPLTAAALLPFFFATTGLKAEITPDSGAFLGMLALVTGATVLGKVAGTTLPARMAGENWRHALALGTLMQTKGLMEVVVLAVLLEAGLIAPPAFSAMVAMAILCTVIAAPATRMALAGGSGAGNQMAARQAGDQHGTEATMTRS